MDIGRSVVKLADTPRPILRNVYGNENVDERSPGRMVPGSSSGLSRHRVGISPVRVRRSINDGVPTAVVTPSPPITLSTRALSGAPQAISAKVDVAASEPRYIRLRGLQNGDDHTKADFGVSATAGPAVFGGPALSRRSRSSVGATGLGLVPRRLEYNDLDGVLKQQLDQLQRTSWTSSSLDAECQVPSNSILTLHSLVDEAQDNVHHPRDDSQERRLKELEQRLLEIEARMANGIAARTPITSESPNNGSVGLPKLDVSDIVRSAPTSSRKTSTPHPVTKGSPNTGTLSVTVPPIMTFDSGIYRVQPTPRTELKSQRDVERLEKKLKHQEETAESLRVQHLKQIEQLTRQLTANDDMTQTLRSRIGELELENEMWRNRFRLYNDVDVAKILRENERLRSRQRKRSSRGEDEEKTELLRKKEQMEEENAKLLASYNELEHKFRSAKEKYKRAVEAFRTRRRQDHVELESLKVTLQLQEAELASLRERATNQFGIAEEEPPTTVVNGSIVSNVASNNEFVNYTLEKCQGITDCLSKICTSLKRHEPLDPEDVLNYGVASGRQTGGEKSFEEMLDGLAKKMTTLHSQVVDLYGDDLANSVTCSVQ